MKRWSSILILIAGLGISISIPTPSRAFAEILPSTAWRMHAGQEAIEIPADLIPFFRYLDTAKSNRLEPALVHFADDCGIDVRSISPRFAQRPGEQWIVVKDLSHATEDQGTDLYGTLAVWRHNDRFVVEQWAIETDTGEYTRNFFCLDGQKITSVEMVSWLFPVESNDPEKDGWGDDSVWTLTSEGTFALKSRHFVDLYERPISEPKLSEMDREAIGSESVRVYSLTDLKIPSSMLQ